MKKFVALSALILSLGSSQALAEYVIHFPMPLLERHFPNSGGASDSSSDAWEAYATANGFAIPSDTDGDGTPNWELGVDWLAIQGFPSAPYPASNSSTQVRFIDGVVTDQSGTYSGNLSVFSGFQGTLTLDSVSISDSELEALNGFSGFRLSIRNADDITTFYGLRDINVEEFHGDRLYYLESIEDVGTMTIGSVLDIPPEIYYSGGVLVPTASDICQPANAYKWQNLSQYDGCGD